MYTSSQSFPSSPLRYSASTCLRSVRSSSCPDVWERSVIFIHNLKLPWGANFSRPEQFGLSRAFCPPYPRARWIYLANVALKTVNLMLTSTDNVTLGSWFTFSEPFFRSKILPGVSDALEAESLIPVALKAYPTVLYLHGNVATRAVPTRVHTYSTFSSRMQVNVLAIDYRGFAESTGYPTERGTIEDALSAIKWLVGQGAKPEDILVIGHSLGAGIATQCVELAEGELGQTFRGLVVIGGQASVPHQMETFAPGGIPVLRPVKLIPGGWGMSRTLGRILPILTNTPRVIVSMHIHTIPNARTHPQCQIPSHGRPFSR